MDAGAGVSDPFCQAATYDGHDGTDLRVLSMADVARGVPVVAVADGTVLRGRDGEPDHLVVTDADRAAVANKECGNGMIVDLGGGYEVQYCHMRQGSLVVKPGDAVKRGQKLGDVGASGMAQFPHVHLTVRRDGKPVDPVSGHALSARVSQVGRSGRTAVCARDVAAALVQGETQLIAFGLAGGPLDHNALSVSGPPPQATERLAGAMSAGAGSSICARATASWSGSSGRTGQEIAASRSDPMNRAKASFSAFAGKKGAPEPGEYEVQVGVERGGAMLVEKSDWYQVE